MAECLNFGQFTSKCLKFGQTTLICPLWFRMVPIKVGYIERKNCNGSDEAVTRNSGGEHSEKTSYCTLWLHSDVRCFLCGSIFCIVLPEVSPAAACFSCGIALTAYGVIKLIGYFSDDLFRSGISVRSGLRPFHDRARRHNHGVECADSGTHTADCGASDPAGWDA